VSNFLAIATVTASLRQMLTPVVEAVTAEAEVTTLRPDAPGNATPKPRVNLYLYQITPNAGWRNADLPTRNVDGRVVQRPQAALDLHYLLSCYGDEGQLEPQRLLGNVVRALHAQSVLTRQMIQSTITSVPFLANSDLADAVELVKFTPIALALEELSKLWSVFFQTPYTLSVAYQGTVVLIESEETPAVALPVRARNVYVMPFRQPVIEQILSQAGPDQPILTEQQQPILAGYRLIIRGQWLSGDVTWVNIGGREVTPAPENVSDTQISLPLPPELRAGVQGVQVVQQLMMGTPPEPHRGVESNVAAFVLHPTVTATTTPVSSRTVNGATLVTVDINLSFTLPVGKTQRVVLLLYEFNAPSDRPPHTYGFPMAARTKPTDPEQTASLTIRATDVIPGTYLIRVQVDGAESPLAMNASGQYASPQVEIP